MAVPEEIQRQVLAEATSATPNFSVDMNSQQFKDVDKAVDESWNQYNQTVGGMIDGVDSYYKDISDTLQQNADKQAQIQQENTDFIIEKIEQQKDQAHKDYVKEQSGAYVDWRKQSNEYGAEAEKMASAGLTNTGYSESSQVSIYNTYQNRVAVARESLQQTILNYNNNIKEAQLQNNATLAQIYSDLAIKQAELSLEGFQYKNQLVLDMANKKIEFENTKWSRYQDILNQINTEKAMAWDAAKYYDNQKWQTEQAEIDRQHELKRDELNRKFEAEQAEIDRKFQKEILEAKNKHEKEMLEKEHQNALAKLKKEHEYEMEQINKQHENNKALITHQSSVNSKAISAGAAVAAVGGRSGSSAVNKKSSISQPITGNTSQNGKQIKTEYYSGTINADASKYGTFSNGYQPKGISGYGKVSKTGDEITISTQTLSGKKQKVVQNVWKTPDGSTWYWEGRQNRYIPIKKKSVDHM